MTLIGCNWSRVRKSRISSSPSKFVSPSPRNHVRATQTSWNRSSRRSLIRQIVNVAALLLNQSLASLIPTLKVPHGFNVHPAWKACHRWEIFETLRRWTHERYTPVRRISREVQRIAYLQNQQPDGTHIFCRRELGAIFIALFIALELTTPRVIQILLLTRVKWFKIFFFST